MLNFDHPILFVLLLLPLLVWRLSKPYRAQRSAIRAPFMEDLVAITGQTPSEGAVVLKRSWIQRILLALVWLLLVVALARPQWVEEPITKTESARDLMIAVDLSGSMEERDFTDPNGEAVDRLTAVKLVLDDFMKRRQGDRLGLIFFGSAAFLQVPFTNDHAICRVLLEQAQVRMAGPQTMMGDAMGLAIKLFEQSTVENRVLIILTDGNDTGSQVHPTKAAEIAARHGVTIYCIAIGDPATLGEQALDEETLQEIARVTNGQYYHANDRKELERIYADLEELVPQEFETLSYRPKRALFHWPLAAILLIILGYHGLMAIEKKDQR
ncbi:VWA domain-containing protein [Planctomycetota bacterium]